MQSECELSIYVIVMGINKCKEVLPGFLFFLVCLRSKYFYSILWNLSHLIYPVVGWLSHLFRLNTEDDKTRKCGKLSC